MSENSWSFIPEIAKDKLVSADQREERVNICKGCEKLSSLYLCDICHCFMPLKTYFKTQQCPLKKW
jgi:hypothetical protein